MPGFFFLSWHLKALAGGDTAVGCEKEADPS